jgi:hypothetical protein
MNKRKSNGARRAEQQPAAPSTDAVSAAATVQSDPLDDPKIAAASAAAAARRAEPIVDDENGYTAASLKTADALSTDILPSAPEPFTAQFPQIEVGLKFEDAVRAGQQVFIKFESNVRAANMELGEIAAKVKTDYGDETLDKLGERLQATVAEASWAGVFSDTGRVLRGDGAAGCTLGRTLKRNKSVWLAWTGAGIEAPAPVSWAVLRELQGHPERERLVNDEPRMTKAKARELMQKWRRSHGKPDPEEQEDEQPAPPAAAPAAAPAEVTSSPPVVADPEPAADSASQPPDTATTEPPPAETTTTESPAEVDRRTHTTRWYRELYNVSNDDVLRCARIDSRFCDEASLREVMQALPGLLPTIRQAANLLMATVTYLEQLRDGEAPTQEAAE